MIKRRTFLIMFLAGVSFIASHTGVVFAGVRLTSVFNNVPFGDGLKTGWGYACLIEGMEKTVLFDTGADGHRLLFNMQRLGKKPEDVDIIVLSHIHHDHVGGLEALLALNPHVSVYVPASFPSSVKGSIRAHKAALVVVTGPMRIAPAVFTTGEMGRSIKEQALVLETAKGLVVVTGCAHPGVANVARLAKELHKEPLYCVMGGFHLSDAGDKTIRRIIEEMKSLGVRTVAPSHCTGEGARALFRAAWDADFFDGGLGAVVEMEMKAVEDKR
ncbi:MAG: MBL fold metallo-hydrolase [Thermodesulfobacteriota bacterium]|nr:MBL fold metallo-hydrolase [Thermodesulfobacteriota bacterium]